jgi:RimJ/RimL family protein N-acetyltransferase
MGDLVLMLKTTPGAHADPFVPAATSAMPAPAGTDWRSGLPTLYGSLVKLRELRTTDAPSLLGTMSSDEVAKFINPPPTTIEGFEKFIAWADRQRSAGQYICFAIVPRGSDTAVGLFQIRSLEPAFTTAEWGFALGTEFWGSGMFMDGARLVVEFAMSVVGVNRLEARAVLRNGRGNGALRKIGAVHEGVLRRSFLRNGEHLDQALWTILADEWLQAKATWGARVIH